MDARVEYCRRFQIERMPARSLYRSCGKRLLDLMICVPILILISPFLSLAAVLIRIDSRGPIFFVQERLGRYGSTFPTYKFRTMTDRVRTSNSEILPGHSEVTRVGAWLRRSKLDELPQLLNVVKGDMSLVGPRPALPEHLDDYNEDGYRRLLERPGLTGLAQIHGNIYLTWPERWHYDARYVETLSARLDVTTLVRTVAVVVLGEQRFLQRVDLPDSDAEDHEAQVRKAA